MNTAEKLRRLCVTQGAYWARVAIVTLVAALLVTGLFASVGQAAIAETLRHSLINAALMAGLAGTLMPWLRRRLDARSLAVQWGLMIPALLGMAVVGAALACGLIVATGAREDFQACFKVSLPIDALLTMAIGVGMTLYEVQRGRVDALTLELRTRELEHERARKMALEARLASLESRLQPHFLFNTLNAITALIQDDPDQAERTIERLAALLRFSLDATGHGLVPLADELKIVADYLAIEQTRLGDRLDFVVDADPEANGWEVPPLAVQTLVENSVKHAIAPRPGGGRIRVEATAADGRLSVTVWDDGPGFTAAAMRPGHGLESLQARLGVRFGPAATLTIAPRDGGMAVTVTVPRGESLPA